MTEFDLTPPRPAQREAIIARLTAEERNVLLEQTAPRAAFCEVFVDNHKDGIYTCRFCVVCLSSGRVRNSTPVRAGQASLGPIVRRTFGGYATQAMGWSAWKRSVHAAAVISGTFFQTVHRRPTSVIASTPYHCHSQCRGKHCRTSSSVDLAQETSASVARMPGMIANTNDLRRSFEPEMHSRECHKCSESRVSRAEGRPIGP